MKEVGRRRTRRSKPKPSAPSRVESGGERALQLSAVQQTFGRRGGGTLLAIADVTLDLRAGEFVALVGPSGCGKSTLIRLAAGLLPPTQGHVRVFGTTPHAARKQHLSGVVFQDPALLPWRTTLSNIELPGELHSVSRRERKAKASAALTAVGLAGFGTYFPRQLSGGMRQRAAVARALVLGARLLLLDEPFAALDQITSERLQQDLANTWAEAGVAGLIVTHSIEEAVFMSDRVAILSARPSLVSGVVHVNAGRPRGESFRFTNEFVNCCRQTRVLLRERHEVTAITEPRLQASVER